MWNAIVLRKGYERLSEQEYKEFSKGDTIWGNDSCAEEIKRWSIDQENEARKELAKCRCSYDGGSVWDIEEYALEFCECDEDGEFISGSDYQLAEN